MPNTFASDADQSPWRRRFDAIYVALRQRITTLEYAPGVRLDVDRLSQEFGVSRTPVRNVLQRLETEGLVRTRHGVGTIVAPVDLKEWRQAMMLRIELASLIGRLKPCRITPELAGVTREAFHTAERLPDERDPVSFAKIDMQAHAAVCRVVGNDILRRVHDEMYFRTARMRILFLRDQSWTREVLLLARDLGRLHEAMETGHAEGVGTAVRASLLELLVRMEPQLAAQRSRKT